MALQVSSALCTTPSVALRLRFVVCPFIKQSSARNIRHLQTVWGSNPGGGGARFPAPIQTGPGAHPASCTMGTESFLGERRPGRDVDHPPPSSAEVMKEQSYTSIPPLGPCGLLQSENLPHLQTVADFVRTDKIGLRHNKQSTLLMESDVTAETFRPVLRHRQGSRTQQWELPAPIHLHHTRVNNATFQRILMVKETILSQC